MGIFLNIGMGAFLCTLFSQELYLSLPGEALLWGMRYPSPPGTYNPESLGVLFPTRAGAKPGTIAHQDREHELELELYQSHTAVLSGGMPSS